MIQKILVFLLALTALTACKSEPNGVAEATSKQPNPTREKAAIISVLNNETKAAFTRDYQGWQDKWVHEPYVTKTYMDFSDSTMTETLGWAEINDFVKTYIEDHPEPDPLPALLEDVDVRLYGTGAWVEYQQDDPGRGRKRETRLMEKVNGEWKIAGMQTTIYGFNAPH